MIIHFVKKTKDVYYDYFTLKHVFKCLAVHQAMWAHLIYLACAYLCVFVCESVENLFVCFPYKQPVYDIECRSRLYRCCH